MVLGQRFIDTEIRINFGEEEKKSIFKRRGGLSSRWSFIRASTVLATLTRTTFQAHNTQGIKHSIIFLKGQVKGPLLKTDKHLNCFKGNFQGTSERWGGAHTGFSKRWDTTFDWMHRTKLNWCRGWRQVPCPMLSETKRTLWDGWPSRSRPVRTVSRLPPACVTARGLVPWGSEASASTPWRLAAAVCRSRTFPVRTVSKVTHDFYHVTRTLKKKICKYEFYSVAKMSEDTYYFHFVARLLKHMCKQHILILLRSCWAAKRFVTHLWSCLTISDICLKFEVTWK